MKCWCGNLDGSRYAMIIATSKREAIALAEISTAQFEKYFKECNTPDGFEAGIYTKRLRIGKGAQWFKGRCRA